MIINETLKYKAPKGYRRLKVYEILRKGDTYVNFGELKPTVSVGRKVLYADMIYIRRVNTKKTINLKLTLDQVKILKLLLNNSKDDNMEHLKRNNIIQESFLAVAENEFLRSGIDVECIYDKVYNLID